MPHIGIYLTDILTHTHKPGIQGEELWADALVKGLNAIEGVTARKYGKNMGYMPESEIAIYFYIPYGERLLGKKNVLLFQNFGRTQEGLDVRVKQFMDCKADLRATISTKLANDNNWEMLWPAIDMDVWQQKPKNDRYRSTLLYIGNNIKNQDKTKDFLSNPYTRVFGYGFGGPSMKHKESLHWYSNAFACLNFGFDTSLGIVTARIFQLAAMKCFIITEPTTEYKDIFGDSIIYANSGKEVAEKVAHYQTHLKEREEKIGKAYQIVKDNYTENIQANNLFNYIKEIL